MRATARLHPPARITVAAGPTTARRGLLGAAKATAAATASTSAADKLPAGVVAESSAKEVRVARATMTVLALMVEAGAKALELTTAARSAAKLQVAV